LAPAQASVPVIRRWLPVAVALVIACAAIAAVWALTRPVSYTATGIVLIDGSPQGSAEVALTRPQIEARHLDFETRAVRQAVTAQLGPDFGSISTSIDLDQAIVTLEVTSSEPELAVSAVRAVVGESAARSQADQVAELERELAQAQALFAVNDRLLNERVAELDLLRSLDQLDQAAAVERMMWHTSNRRTAQDQRGAALEADIALATGRGVVIDLPDSATENRPNAALYGAGGGVLAAAVAAIAISGLARPGRRLEAVDDLDAVTDLPVLATVPHFARRFSRRDTSLVVGRADAGAEAEAFRFARTAVGLAAASRGAQTIAITSPEPNSGKTVVTANLAAALAGGGTSTLVVDGDVLSSATAEALGLQGGANSLPYILAGRDVGLPITTVGLPSGATVDFLGRTDIAPWSAPRPELTTSDVGGLLAASTTDYDTTLVDCPPVLAVADSVPLCAAADATIVVARVGSTTLRELAETLDRLRRAGVSVLGIIATRVPDSDAVATYDLTSAYRPEDRS